MPNQKKQLRKVIKDLEILADEAWDDRAYMTGMHLDCAVDDLRRIIAGKKVKTAKS